MFRAYLSRFEKPLHLSVTTFTVATYVLVLIKYSGTFDTQLVRWKTYFLDFVEVTICSVRIKLEYW